MNLRPGQPARGPGAAARARRRPTSRAGAALLLAALLAACATPPPADAPDTAISGRLSLRVDGQPERAVNAGFDLSGGPRNGELLLSGPLGTSAVRARWSPGQAVLQAGGQETRHADLDALAAAALGEPLPMAALFDWLRGRAWPEAPSAPRLDGAPGFEQLGWRIDLSRWAEGWVEAVRAAPPVITVRARVERPA